MEIKTEKSELIFPFIAGGQSQMNNFKSIKNFTRFIN